MFYDLFLKMLPQYKTLSAAVQKTALPAGVTGISHINKVQIISALSSEHKTRSVVVTSDEGEAVKICEDLKAMGQRAILYPVRDLQFKAQTSYSRQYEQSRVGALSVIADGEYDQVVCSVDALIQYTLPPEHLIKRSFSFKVGQEIPPKTMIRFLVAAGYVNVDPVEGSGQFAHRGGIVDVFPSDSTNPYRIEFFGDEIDSIAPFDVESQRRLDPEKSINIPPVSEILFDTREILCNRILKICSGLKAQANALAKQNLLNEVEDIKNGGEIKAIDRFLPIMSDEPATLFDYVSDANVFVSESNKVKERVRTYWWQLSQDIESLFEQGVLCPGLDKFALDFDQLCEKYTEFGAIFLDSFAKGSFDVSIREMVNFNAMGLSPFIGDVSQLCDDISPLILREYAVVMLCSSEKSGKLLVEDMRAKGITAEYHQNPDTAPRGMVTVTTGGLSSGFEYPEVRFALFTSGKPTVKKSDRQRGKSKNGFNSLDELHKGDYVVHSVHGIGVFQGINKITSQGITKDYITIAYAGQDTLYVPVTQLDLVSKYIGPSGDDVKIKLNKLGSSDWQKTRKRVKAAVKDMAKELIALYSARMSTPGYAFSPDTDIQNDFERRFEFEETDDQLRCTDEIKHDMERAVPMDRLLCGDVGFGKTEVALRAAFKCIADGKQCALLVPTTILAWQHYQTVLRRMEGIPVNIELLSRFRNTRQQAAIIKKLKSGEVDMVIGTHRLISKDVEFRDLGLMIVDEEQRFGVAQKEKLKERFKTVDVLTLSATPIPRTLNMAMSGLRDMSIIEEAPVDRHPVQTYVMEYDKGVIIDAMRKELRRGGQVYYLHNNIETITRRAATLQSLLPEAVVGIAHGQMNEDELSEIWRKLIEKEIDILVCTTIIETGVDVSNVNTLIIENSDRMGLSQLHQLRGRVGRSSRRAYAFFTFRGGKALSEIATRRLEAVREFTEFGSGLKIAMRDLEIRGAGNLLGSQQHGQMESVGYDMYLKLLSDAISEEKGDKKPEEDAPECIIDLMIEAHIPENYIENLSQRLAAYRRIADIRTKEDSFDVVDEFVDRYGQPPKSVLGLIRIALLRNRAAQNGFYEATQKQGNLILYHKSPDVDCVMMTAAKMRGRILLNAGNKPYISVKLIKGQTVSAAFEEYLNNWEECRLKDTKA